jgi:N-acetylmuramoyl-L-alanine amidase
LAARLIEGRLRERLGLRASRGIRQTGAALDVLRGTGVPAVLLEVGFIDHPEEGARLASPAGQDLLASALAAAITDFARR